VGSRGGVAPRSGFVQHSVQHSVRGLGGCYAAKAAIRGHSSNSRRRPAAVAHSRQLPSWLKIIAAILEQPVIEKILMHLGLQAREPPR